ncbi:hypothetical protein SASPL_141687 [Salvia splendens]|uniref:TCP domain-containing protein n=1 Tax=Salvia splendens TaxID=180675 RepID=A0A8X8Z8T6_SALSN|nr:hypothetical protein SASPL_141687 [Salvia splendens]
MGKSGGGEIVEVEGGHIVRGSGGNSKVCTAKGPRDRRVRLAAHTAIQFYDVQDRLGYDRPSKAVDWLIHKAKSAIDGLAHLPPWHPTDVNVGGVRSLKESESLHRHDECGDGEGRRQFVGSTFVPPSLDSDAIKSFFPEASFASSDLRQSFQDPTNLDAYLFNPPQNHFISQRGTLQSSNTHPLQPWMDPNHPINPFPFHYEALYSHNPSSAR